jgi:diapolycopene oxygenase
MSQGFSALETALGVAKILLLDGCPAEPQPGVGVIGLGFDHLAQLSASQPGYNLRDNLLVTKVLTPVDIARITGARRGALYGASSNNRWAAFRRPHNRCAEVEGLYFAGGTAHPGGGVPMVTLAGKVASKMLLEDGV